MRFALIAVALLAASPALAEEKTVTLTEADLGAVIEAKSAEALSMYLARRSAAAFDKVNKAFAPPAPTAAK